MKRFVGIVLVVLGIILLVSGMGYINGQQDTINFGEKKLNEGYQYYQNYTKDHPIRDEMTMSDYEQEMLDYKKLKEFYETNWIERKSYIPVFTSFLIVISGLIYMATGIILIMDLKWVIPMMGSSFLSYIISICFVCFYNLPIMEYTFKLLKVTYKLQYTLGIFKGNYYKAAVSVRDTQAGMVNIALLIATVAYLLIPMIYLIKALLQDEKKG